MGEQAETKQLADRLAIHELAIRYCDATTRGDWAALAQLWMPDGTWAESAPFNERYVGIDQILARTREMLDATDVFIQVCYGVVIEELSGNHARAHATVQGIARGGFGSSVNYVIFKDRLVKSDGEWRYADRDLHNIYVDANPLPGSRMLTRDEMSSLCDASGSR